MFIFIKKKNKSLCKELSLSKTTIPNQTPLLDFRLRQRLFRHSRISSLPTQFAVVSVVQEEP